MTTANEEMHLAHTPRDRLDSCPEIYRCPISKELMTNAVMLHDDGQTYDEESLKEWLTTNNRSPLTGVELQTKSYTKNYALQQAIEQFTQYKKTKESKENEKEEETETETETKELKEFLSKINLSQYLETFISSGFISMNDFNNIKFDDLISMNIPIIHSRRLIKEIETKSINKSDTLSLRTSTSKNNKLQNKSDTLNCNILLLGDISVGKTSLRKRLEFNSFLSTHTTLGIELSCLTADYNNKNIQINIYDPSGQKQNNTITKSFFERTNGAAIIFSADNISSWKNVQYWLNEIEDNNNNNNKNSIEYMLICNKIDLILNNTSENEKLNNIIKNAINIATNKHISFYTTSAKSGESVKHSFQELIYKIVSSENKNDFDIIESINETPKGMETKKMRSKIVIVGEAAVGKTTLQKSMMGWSFEPCSKSTFSVNSIHKKTNYKYNNQILIQIDYEIFDTPGLDRYADMICAYLRGVLCLIVVYDCINLKSFEKAKWWINYMENNASGYDNIILIANKIDINNNNNLIKKGRLYATERGMSFLEISAMNKDNINILLGWINKQSKKQIQKSPHLIDEYNKLIKLHENKIENISHTSRKCNC